MRSRGPLPLLVVVVVATFVAPAVAAEGAALKVILGPFSPKGHPAGELRDAVELELVVHEELLVGDPDDLLAEVGEDLSEAPPARIGRALDALGQDALVRGEPRGKSWAVVFIQRAGDGAIVYGRKVELAEAKKDLNANLLGDLVPNLLDVAKLEPLTSFEVSEVEGDDDVLVGVDKKHVGIVHDSSRDRPDKRPDPETPHVDDRPPTTTTPPRTTTPPPTPRLGEPPAKRPYDLLRLSAGAAPTWYFYRACDPAKANVVFNCRAERDIPPTEVKPGLVPMPGLIVKATLAPAEFFAFTGDAAMFLTVVRTRFPEGSGLNLIVDGGEPNIVNALGGAAAIGLEVRYLKVLGPATLMAGGRAGWRGMFLAAQGNHLEAAGAPIDQFTLLPSYMSNAGALGGALSASFADRARVALDLDLLPVALHFEMPTHVGSDALMLAAGVHAQASVDVDIAFGAYAGLVGSFDALNAFGKGEGSRFTRALDEFHDGQVDFWQGSLALAVGWRY